MSSLRANKELIANFTKLYSHHRPFIQRVLNSAFILYVLGTTYRGLSARPAPSSRSSKGNGKGKADGKDGKAPRVAVRLAHYLAR